MKLLNNTKTSKVRILKIILLLMILNSCERTSISNEKKPIKEDTLFDVSRMELVHETEDTLWFEPIVKKIPKFRKIFKKGKNYVYKAKYKDEHEKLLSENLIKVIPTGTRINFAPEKQDLVYYEFIGYKNDSIKLSNHKINVKLNRWRAKTGEGIIENVERVWIHPMRVNQYKFTEVAPFPEVNLPIKIGDQWDSNLNIGRGWGEWSETSGESNYEVIRKDTFLLENKILNCWLIKGESKFPFGSSQIEYKFNEDYGFVIMKYTNYKGEKLEIRMVDVE